MQPADPARASCAREPCARRQVRPRADRGGALILGAVIAGGAARRFGSDKALALLDGKRLIDHAAEALHPHIDALVVCGRTLEGWTSLADLPRPGLGPLGGVAAALAYAGAHGFASVLTIGCDMPDVPEGVVTRLIANVPSYCADAPILGHWPADATGALIDRLGVPAKAGHERKNPGLSMHRWADAIGAARIPSPRPLANINTRADLAAP